MDSNVGIKISNPSYDANTCADYQLLFNSNWPSVGIAYENYQSVPYNGQVSVTFNHNLGYVPYAMGWFTIDGVNSGDCQGGWTSLQVDSETITVGYEPDFQSPGFGDAYGIMDSGQPMTFSVKCYNIDLTQSANFTSEIPPQAGNVPYDPNFGLKLAKQGRDINSNDLRDFIIHTRGQAPAVLSVLTQANSVPTQNGPAGTLDIAYTNPAGYTAWIFPYAISTRANGSTFYQQIGVGGQITNQNQGPVCEIDGATFTMNVPPTGGTMLVLRDPMFAANKIFATY